MAAARPFRDLAALTAAADRIWADLDRDDWLEAFAAHPKIGERAGPAWSAQEQSGVAGAPREVIDRLVIANRDYEARFGYIFIVCATGKSAAEMLDLLERRLGHAPEQELRIAADEQRTITRLRLGTLLDVDAGRGR
jgi:OHCU decarboxylase